MDSWRELKIGELSRVLSSKRIFYKDYVESGIPFYRSKEIIEKSEGKDIDNPLFISIEKFNSIKNKFGAPKDGDVLISSVGMRSGIPYLVKNDGDFYFKDGNLIWFRDFSNDLNSEFLCYWFKSDIGLFSLENMMIGSAQPALTISGIKEIELNLPLLPEQKAIAEVLSSLDDKIDLLHRQNKTLEAMAETLFRQWFVEEADESWEDGFLSDLIEVKYGKDHKKLLDGEIAVYGSGGIMRFAEKALYNRESVLIPRKGSLNNVIYINEPFWTVDTMFYSTMKKPNIAKFIFQFVKKIDLAAMNVGSAVPSMTTRVLNSMPLLIPSDDFFKNFENSVTPWYDKIASNTNQIQTLTKLRDTLLPKLMSGEVRVKMN